MASEEISVRFCPKCKGFNVKYVQGLANFFGVVPKQRCLDCGFEAGTFPVLVTTKEKLNEAVKKLKTKNKKKVVKKIVRKKK